jgi:hypothetical protein
MKKLPIGVSDYKQIIEEDYYFGDTTEFIADFYKQDRYQPHQSLSKRNLLG